MTLTPFPSAKPTPSLVIGSYGSLSGKVEGDLIDLQMDAHHISQNAAYQSVIPQRDGLSIALQGWGNGTPHTNAHSILRDFWSPYQRNGALFGQLPTNQQYLNALETSLGPSGARLSAPQAAYVTNLAAQQQRAYGIKPSAQVPDVPRLGGR